MSVGPIDDHPERYFETMFLVQLLTRSISANVFLSFLVFTHRKPPALIVEQVEKVGLPIHALFLVGGFARSEYLQRVEVHIQPLFRKTANAFPGPVRVEG